MMPKYAAHIAALLPDYDAPTRLIWEMWAKAEHPVTPVRVEGAWQHLVSQKTFDRVRKALQQRAPARVNPRRTASRYLLSGLLKCGRRGKALIGQDAKSGRFTYYVCGTLIRQGAASCTARYLNANRLEGFIVDNIKRKILTEENLTELAKLVYEEMDSMNAEYRERLATVEAELADIQRRLDRLYDALETGKFTFEDLAPRIYSHRYRQDQLQAAHEDLEDLLSERQVNLADLPDLGKYVEDLRALLQEGSLAEQKAFIRKFVQEIVV